MTRKFKDSDKPSGELWVRLAELYVEKGSLVDYRRQKDFDTRLQQFNKGKSKVKPVLNNGEARSYFKKSVQLYEWFQKDFPNDPKIPQALYFLGFNYFELNEPKKGEKYYSDLAARFPNSRSFVDEASFALGEYYFENENWKDAYKRYSPVIKNKKHNLNAMATYKGAWCLYRLGRNQEALKYMEYIITLNKQASDRDSKKQLKAKLVLALAIGWVLFIGKGVFVPIVFSVLVVYVIIGLARMLVKLPLVGRFLPPQIGYPVSALVIVLSLAGIASLVAGSIGNVSALAPQYAASLLNAIQSVAERLGVELAPTWATLRQDVLAQINTQRLIGSTVVSVSAIVSTLVVVLLYVAFLLIEQRTFSTKIAKISSDPQNVRQILYQLSYSRNTVRFN